jgi:hypothetical protein
MVDVIWWLSWVKEVAPFLQSMPLVLGALVFLGGMALGTGLVLAARAPWLMPLGVSEKSKLTALMRAWSASHNDTVFECFRNEDKDMKHLARNLDHLTRPVSSVNLFDDPYVVVAGTKGSRLVYQRDFNTIQRARVKQIRVIAATIGGEAADFDWESLIPQLRCHSLSHIEHIERIRDALAATGCSFPPAGEYSPQPAAAASRSRRSAAR